MKLSRSLCCLYSMKSQFGNLTVKRYPVPAVISKYIVDDDCVIFVPGDIVDILFNLYAIGFCHSCGKTVGMDVEEKYLERL